MSPIPLGILAASMGGGFYAATLTGSNAIQTLAISPDGGYVLAGSQNSGPLGGVDGIVVKLSPQGSIIWQKNIGGSGDNYATATVDNSNNVYVAVTYPGTKQQITVIKLDSNGNLLSQRILNKLDTRPNEGVTRMVWGKDNNLYICGSGFEGNSYAPQSFFMKLDSSLNIAWTRSWFNDRDEYCAVNGCGVTSTGDIYAAVYNVYATTYGDPGLARVNSSGTQQWHKVRYYTGDNQGAYEPSWDAVIDSTNTPYHMATGWFWTTGGSHYVRKLNSSGVEQWVTSVTNNTYNGGDAGALAVDASDNIYALTRRGGTIVTKLNSSGTVLWKRDIQNFNGSEIKIDIEGNVVVVGTAFSQPAIVKMAPTGATLGSASLPGGTITLAVSSVGGGNGSNTLKDGSSPTSRSVTTSGGSLTVQNLTKSVQLAVF